MKTLNLTVQPVDLNIAGIHEKSEICSIKHRVKLGDQDENVIENIVYYSHPDVNARIRT